MYFDTHTHITFPEFDADRDEIMQACIDQKVWMANVGTDYSSSKKAVEFTSRFADGVYATIGLHPTEETEFDENDFAELITDKVVAVGECGLDYYHQETTPAKQKIEFSAQMAFAQKHGLPLVIHCREAYTDLLAMMKAEYRGSAVIHSFTDTWETAKKFLDLGYLIALNGILTFDKTERLQEVCKNLPSDRILAETDAPYLTPEPHRGRRNKPYYVRHVIEKIAEIRGLDVGLAAAMTFENACNFYNIKARTNKVDPGGEISPV